MADAARHVTIEDCEIGHVGIYAVWFRHACSDCTLRHCYIHDFGAGAVRVGEAGIVRDEAQRTGHIEIDNNIMRHGGRDLSLRRGPVDRAERRQPRHAQRNRRPLLHRHLRRLDLGLPRGPGQTEYVRLQSRPSPGLGPAERHGRHLYARPLRRHRGPQQRLPRHLFQFLRRLGNVYRRRQHGHPLREQPRLPHQDGQFPPALRQGERAAKQYPGREQGTADPGHAARRSFVVHAGKEHRLLGNGHVAGRPVGQAALRGPQQPLLAGPARAGQVCGTVAGGLAGEGTRRRLADRGSAFRRSGPRRLPPGGRFAGAAAGIQAYRFHAGGRLRR